MNLKVYGIALTLCTDEFNLWWDSDEDHKGTAKPGFGILFSLKAGWVLRPIGKFWKKGFWTRNKDYNAWVSGNHWFVLKFPFFGLPFISIAVGKWGAYLGFKTYGVDWTKEKNPDENYEAWLDSKYIKKGNQALAPSGSLRRTRVK